MASLKVKFPAVATIIFLIIFSLISYLSIRYNVNVQKESLFTRAKTFAVLATKPIGDSYQLYFDAGYLKFREQTVDTLALNEDIIRVQIISVGGSILFDTINIDTQLGTEGGAKIEDEKIIKAVSSSSTTEIVGADGDVTGLVVPYVDDFGSRPFSVRYVISYESIYESLNLLILGILLLAAAFLLLSIFTMVLLVNKSILSPLDRIVVAAREITHGNFGRKIELKTGDELEDLASSLNQMTERLKKNIRDLRELDKMKDEFVYLVSHNLRTPLTIIKGYLDTLVKNKSLDSDVKKNVGKIAQGSKQLENMTESLVNLVALEKRRDVLVKRPLDLNQILEQSVNKFRQDAAKRGIAFVSKLPKHKLKKIFGDEQKISQAIESLIDNAVKFNKENGKITIILDERDGSALISIKDSGVGISEKEKEKVFQKFHRATDMLTYNYEGIGLGLYLTKLIAEAHGGKIWFESKTGEGTTFYLQLPLKEEQKEGSSGPLDHEFRNVGAPQ